MIESSTDSKVFGDSRVFEDVVRPLLEEGLSIRFQARGASMSPAIRDGEVVEVTPVIVTKLRKDDIVLVKSNAGFRLHRIVLADPANDLFITRGDCGQQDDPELKGSQIFGLAHSKEVRLGRNIVQARFRGVGGWLLRSAARAQYIGAKALRRSATLHTQGVRYTLFVVFLLLVAGLASAQVLVDGTGTNGAANLTGVGNSATLNFTHTTGTGTNRLLIVGVSVN